MKSILRITVFMVLLVFVNSCSSDSDDDLMNPVPTGKITYDKHIKPVITANCLGCHGNPTANNAPFSLTTYNEVKARSAGILNAISAGIMPPSGKLPQATINAVDQWVKDGLLEN